jgi:ribose transport system substrate-binding protein
MKRAVALAVLLGVATCFAVFAGGTSESKAPSSETVPAKETYKFAWIMPDMMNPFWIYMRQGAEKAVAELRKEGTSITIYAAAPIHSFNAQEQVDIFDNVIQMKVDGIAMNPCDLSSMVKPIEKAMNAGIPTVTVSTDVPDSKRITHSGVDDTLWAYNVAKYLFEKMNGKGNVVIMEGTAGHYIGQLRVAGFKKALAEFPNIKLLDLQPADWNREKGMAMMENFLQKYPKGQLQGVICGNDEEAIGAIEAIQAAGREKEMLVTGIDGNQDAANAIKAGRMLATSWDCPWCKGYNAIKVLVDYEHGKMPQPKTLADAKLIDKTNCDWLLEQFKYYEQFYKP